MQSIQGPASLCPDPTHTHCRHSREPFDAAFRVINERRDISPTAKLVHAHLVTIHRTGRDETQTEIGEALGLSRHQVWRAIGELVAVDLVQTIRYGLGRPNGYVLLGLAADDLNGRASASRPGTLSRARTFQTKKTDRRSGIDLRDESRDYLATSEGWRVKPRT